MSDAPAERWLDRAWSLLIVSSALYFLTGGEADNDLWLHLFSGRVVLGGGVPHADAFSHTAAGAPWVDHEWLTQAVFAALFAAAGPIALWLFKVAVAAADRVADLAAGGAPGAVGLLDAYDTTLVLTRRGVPTRLRGRPEWRLFYTDQVAALYGTSGDPAIGPRDAPRGWLPFP